MSNHGLNSVSSFLQNICVCVCACAFVCVFVCVCGKWFSDQNFHSCMRSLSVITVIDVTAGSIPNVYSLPVDIPEQGKPQDMYLK